MIGLYILIAIVAAGFVIFVFGKYIYNICNNKPVEKCDCANDMRRAIKKAKKDINKKKKCCSCS